MTLASLFEPGPGQWGFRGDPHLWAELRARFAAVALPRDPAELDRLLGEGYEALTGRALESDEPVYVARYDHGGMSRGTVSPRWWKATGLPLLRARHREAVSERRELGGRG